MHKLTAFLVLALAPALAQACSCAYGLLSNETVNAAKGIFIFQIVSARVLSDGDEPPLSRVVEAEIRVVEQLKGASKITSLQYTTLWCCGSSLDVGHYYAAFLDKPKNGFLGHAGNLILIGDHYWPAHRKVQELRDVVANKRTIESAFGEFPSGSIEQMQPPPPPCAPPTLKDST